MIDIDSLSVNMAGVLCSGYDMPSALSIRTIQVRALSILINEVDLKETEKEDFKGEVLSLIDKIAAVLQVIRVLRLAPFLTQVEKNRRLMEAQMQINRIIQEGLENFFVEKSIEFNSPCDELDDEMSDNEVASETDEDKENKATFDPIEPSRRKRKRAEPEGPNIRTFR